jgi:hypothetical protein
MSQVNGVKALAGILRELCQIVASSSSEQVEHLSCMVKDAQCKVSKLQQDLAQVQRDVRRSAAGSDEELLCLKLSNRDAARVNLCLELRDLMAGLAQNVCNQNQEYSEGKNMVSSMLGDARSHVQKLQSTLDSARDCVIRYNVSQSQSEASGRMGAAFDASICKSTGIAEALRLWHTWEDSLQYEKIAEATDCSMKAAHAACAQSLGGVFGIEEQPQEQYDNMKEAVIAAAKAVDCEAELYASSPVS